MLVLLVTVIIFFAAACQATLGFGFALVLVPLLSLFWNIKSAIVISLLFSSVSSVLTAVELRKHTNWRIVGGLFAGSLVGVPAGAALLVVASAGPLRLVIASVIILSTLIMLRDMTFIRPSRPLTASLVVGAISGALRSATSMGGPPVTLFLLSMRYPAATFVGTSATFYLLGGTVSVIALGFAGRISPDEVALCLATSPALLAGLGIGRYVRTRLPEHAFRFLAIGLLLWTSVLILAPAVWDAFDNFTQPL